MALDAAAWEAVLFARGCGFDAAVEHTIDVATIAMFALLVGAAASSAGREGLGPTWPPLAVCAVGLLAGKVLKNVVGRDRPSMLPDVALGHSFPSGHVMNTVLATLAIIVLTAGFRSRRWWWAAGTALIAVITAGRVLAGSHWLLDVIGGARCSPRCSWRPRSRSSSPRGT